MVIILISLQVKVARLVKRAFALLLLLLFIN
jgi:hypothetical protein